MKRIGFALRDEAYKELRIKAIREDKSVQKYLSELVEKDLQKEKIGIDFCSTDEI